MKAPKMKCKDCGKVTRESTVGSPVGSCPQRKQVYATHRYEVVEGSRIWETANETDRNLAERGEL